MALVARASLLVLVLALQVPGGGARGAEPGAPTDVEVKAAFLYHFARYVDWPARTEGVAGEEPFVVGVLGQDPFGGLLDQTLAGKEVRGRRLVLRRYGSVEEAREARILFIGSSERPELGRILRALEGRPVLTVGEMDHFAARGGMVGFRVEGEVVRFDINSDQVARAGLKMSSQLLKLARIVRTGTEG